MALTETPNRPIADRALEWRVLIAAPTGDDAHVLSRILADAGIATTICADSRDLCRQIELGAAAAVVAEEAITSDAQRLLDQTLLAQPEWSDFPLIVMAVAERQRGWQMVRNINGRAYAILLQRPVPTATLLSSVRTAMQSRARQFQVRDELLKRRRAEQALRESETRFRSLADTAPAMLWVTEPDGSCSFLSQGWVDYTGQSNAQQGLDAGWLDALHPDDRAPALVLFTNVNKRREPFDLDYRIRRRDGQYRWAISAGRPRFSATGEFLGYIGSVIDVHERRQAEGDRQQFFSLVESSGEFIGMCDMQMMPFYVNAAGLHMVGLKSLEQAWQTPVPEFFFPEDRPFILGEFFQRVQHDGRGEVEVRFRHFETGDPIWVIYSVVALTNDLGLVTGYGTVTRDITERKQTETLLEAQKQSLEMVVTGAALKAVLMQLTRVVEQLSDGQSVASILLLDDEGRLRNGASPGLPADFLAAIDGLEANIQVGTCSAAAACGEVVVTRDIAADPQWKDFKQFPLALGFRAAWSKPITARDGRVLGTFGTYFRERREPNAFERQTIEILARTAALAIERKQSEAALREADRHKDEFLATFAHELRNPLAPLQNALTLLDLATDKKGTFDQIREMMERQLAQMVRLIDDLLDVGRISHGKIELRRTRVELASIIWQAVEAYRDLAERSNQQLHVALPPQPIPFEADAVRLVQVFGNLINNACKYTQEGGEIWITAERRDGSVAVSVKDTGIGIPIAKLESIFEMFSQVDHSLERSQTGLGIGLTLVRRLVELHGGTVTAYSDGAGAGSEFVVQLPVLTAETKTHEPAASSAHSTVDAASNRVLVVDDNHDAACSLVMLLEAWGNETQVARNGAEAVEAARAFKPDLILLDLGLPVMNGYDVCQVIRREPWGKTIAIVALTGWGQEEDRRKSKEAGFDGHLLKPVDHTALKHLLAQKRPRPASSRGE